MKLKVFEVTNSVLCEDHFNIVLAYSEEQAIELVRENGSFYDTNFKIKELTVKKTPNVLYSACSTSYGI